MQLSNTHISEVFMARKSCAKVAKIMRGRADRARWKGVSPITVPRGTTVAITRACGPKVGQVHKIMMPLTFELATSVTYMTRALLACEVANLERRLSCGHAR